jgi:hypothetical protein
MTKSNKKTKNTKKTNLIDLLDEDRAIANQKFVCVSFISPEDYIEDRNQYYFKEFLKYWDVTKSVEKYSQFLNFISYKYNINLTDLNTDLEEFMVSEKPNYASTIQDDYKTFVDKRGDDLETLYNKSVKFRTSTRGIKVRGVYPSIEEAEIRCKSLREVDPSHDIYVGPVGMWMPWDPTAYKTGRTEYMESELNELMHEKHNSEVNAKQDFDSRIKEAKNVAMENNKKIAEETGNKLTQDIDEKGNLFNIASRQNGGEVDLSSIRDELFGDNVVLKPGDHGLSLLQPTETTDTTDESTNETKDESTNETTDESTNETTDESTNETTDESTNETTDESTI